jgi:hypothetical protein
MNWKILEVHADGELITHVRYYAEKNSVDTEGYCYLTEPKLVIPYADVTEEMVIEWVKKEVGEQVEARLDAQLSVKSSQKLAPWQKTFTIEV